MIQGLICAMLLASVAVGAAGAPAEDLVAAQRARIAERAKSPRTPAHVAFVSNGVADFWTIAKAGALAAGTQLGCTVPGEFPGAGLSDQTRMLEHLVTRGIDAGSVSPIDPANQGEVLSLVAERSFLITNDSDAPKSPRLCYVGMDNYAAGRLCGELAREGLPKGGKVAIYIGRLEQDNARRRWLGFVAGLLGRSNDPARPPPRRRSRRGASRRSGPESCGESYRWPPGDRAPRPHPRRALPSGACRSSRRRWTWWTTLPWSTSTCACTARCG
ncbi:MAG: substrate-binding domain-containing protein, partial [Phycisphaerales bacterium]